MSVGITVGAITDELGASSFVHAFFSTLSAHCEPKGWGTRLPRLMRELYQGRLPHAHAAEALGELRRAREELARLPPSRVVWDIEDPSARPPWGDPIAPSITSLADYFVSSTGRDVFALLDEALRAAQSERRDALLR